MRTYYLITLCGILLTACSAIPTPTLAPTVTIIPTLPPTSTSEPATTVMPQIEWATYINDERGFSFEYPAVYDEPAYACGPREDGIGGFAVGNRISIAIQPQLTMALELVADDFVANVNQEEQRVSTQVEGEPAITVDYRFGGTNRFGTVTFVRHAEQLWSFNWTAGGFCDPDGKVFEGDAYAHLLETFQFVP